MAGGLLQLVAYGAQDQFLTGDPLITFFKAVYRHHTNFAMESIRQDFNGSIKNGNKVSCTISRNGDLITDCWLEFQLKTSASAPFIGDSMLSCIKTIELEIGGQRIDRHTGDWLRIWSELSLPAEKKGMYDRMVNQIEEDYVTVSSTGFGSGNGEIKNFYVPLQFFFCRNPGLALPLIALQYHEVKIIIEFNDVATSRQTGGINKSMVNLDDFDTSFYVNYIYLDVDERRRFAQTSHQILIEQLQYTQENLTKNIRLNFNHPVKELIWVLQTTYSSGNASTAPGATFGTRFGFYDYDSSVVAPAGTPFNALLNSQEFFSKAQLKLNNQDRFSERIPEFFRFVQPYQYHTRVPSIPIYVYSFSLKPEEHQPSGTCNFSRIDNAYLNFETLSPPTDNPTTIKLFAVNYNVLRITSGMGGLAFSN